MNELIELLNRLKQNSAGTNEALVQYATELATALCAEQQVRYEENQNLNEENQKLNEEVKRLSQIISDVRERDARKKCLCRGFN